ncbi:MAG TPA: molybdopterin cofactor-binding domain-containing protein [Terriglobia bacterium]|nr:molybdopterin cofactor-binding domain-containing protein [Terriglobia bacterium]
MSDMNGLQGLKGEAPNSVTHVELEPERYELSSPSSYHFELGRREFFRILGGGIVVACILKDASAFQESGGRRGSGFDERLPQEISAWLHIGEGGVVTVYTGKVEVGQNSRTALTQAVAEELRVVPRDIRMVMGDTDLTPFDMGTFGSRTTPTMNPQLRRASAAALDVLMGLAADAWKVERSKLTAADGKITDPASARTISYGELAKGKQLAQAIPAEDPLTPAARWTVMGESLPKIDGADFVNGKHRYPSDIALPGMLHGKVLRPPSFGATLGSLDLHEAEAMPGVTVVHDGDFVGVAAPSVEIASRAVAAIHADWKPNPAPQPSSRELFDYLKKNPDQAAGQGGFGGRSDHQVGSMEKGLADAGQRLQQTYTVAYIAHTPLEPRAAVAQWENGKLTVWTGTQRPFGVRSELMEAFRLSQDQVRVQMPDTGSGYGGKHTGDAAVEAARLAKAAGKPVKLVWTREEEFTWAYFRPAGVIDVAGGARSNGTLTAWEFHNYNSGGAGIGTPYDVPNQHIQFHPTQSPLRQGSYRALAATANHFARESFMDELAHAVKMDPLDFRLKNLKDERLKAVFESAARKFGWAGSKPPTGHGFGIGGGVEKGGYVATCAEVAVDRANGQVRIVRVVTAFDCGAVVNPDQLRNQIEGANVMGIGGALFEAIEFENGRILNGRFSKYRVPRFSDVPEIEIVLVDRKDQPSAGAGESPIVGLAPAVGNAIFGATDVRLRSLPMAPNGLKL